MPHSCKRCPVNGLRETFGLVGALIRPLDAFRGESLYAPKKRRGAKMGRSEWKAAGL